MSWFLTVGAILAFAWVALVLIGFICGPGWAGRDHTDWRDYD